MYDDLVHIKFKLAPCVKNTKAESKEWLRTPSRLARVNLLAHMKLKKNEVTYMLISKKF